MLLTAGKVIAHKFEVILFFIFLLILADNLFEIEVVKSDLKQLTFDLFIGILSESIVNFIAFLTPIAILVKQDSKCKLAQILHINVLQI